MIINLELKFDLYNYIYYEILDPIGSCYCLNLRPRQTQRFPSYQKVSCLLWQLRLSCGRILWLWRILHLMMILYKIKSFILNSYKNTIESFFLRFPFFQTLPASFLKEKKKVSWKKRFHFFRKQSLFSTEVQFRWSICCFQFLSPSFLTCFEVYLFLSTFNHETLL